MIKSITFFSEEEELQQLTGLNHDELWEAGFNLDDWDFGLVVDEPLSQEWGAPYYEHWLYDHLDAYCSGRGHVQHNGKYYYMA